jgi:hypothetical protein
MSELVRLLNDLGRDARLAEAYAENPESVMSGYDLGEAEVEAMKSGDVERVRKISGLDEVHLTNSTIKSY